MTEWWESAPKVGAPAGANWWDSAPVATAKKVPGARPGWGAVAGRSGTAADPYDLSDGGSRKRIGKGKFYVDPEGNIRRNDNFDAGNPIIVPAGQRKTTAAPKKGFLEQRGADFIAPGKAAVKAIASNYQRNTLSEDDIAEARRLAASRGTSPAQEMAAIQRRKQLGGAEPRGGLSGVAQQFTSGVKNDVDLLGGLGGLALSPITGALDTVLRPAARGMERAGFGVEEENLSTLNTALMGARPAPGGSPVPRRPILPPALSPAARKLVPVVKPLKKQDPTAMRARVEEFRAAGIDPALVDVMDDTGRGFVRATASRPTPARQAATDFRDTRALDLPDRISNQAKRIVSNDPRSPVQIQEEIAGRRAAQGDAAFGAVRNERVPLSTDAVAALRSPDGRDAIRQAARDALNSMDPAERNLANDLNRLADELLDQPGRTRITVGMAQAISKSLLDKAEAAKRIGSNNTARLQGDLGRAVRDNARTTVPGYDEALSAYAADSRLLEASELGPQFMRGNADEFGRTMATLGPDETAIARAAMRREIERAAGENVAAAPGVARKLSAAPEQQLRNRAALGPDDAMRLERSMGLEERLVRNANDIAPRGGSQTQLRQQDAETAAGVIGGIQKFARGDVIGLAMDRLKTLGLRDDLAQQITEMAIDPARTDEALAALERIVGPSQARQIMSEIMRPDRLVPVLSGSQSGRDR